MDIPELFLQSPSDHDSVHSFGGNTVVLLNREFNTEKAKIVLNKHIITFGIVGEKYFHSLEEDTFLKANEAIFLKKGLFLTTEKVAKSSIYKSIIFFLDDKFLSDFYERNKQYFSDKLAEDSMSYFKFDNSEMLKSYVQSLLPYFERENDLSEPLFKVKLEELLLNLVMNDHEGVFKTFLMNINHQVSLGIKPFMEKNFTRNLRVEDFAYLIGMSHSSFKRQFEKSFKTSPAKWLKEQRLKRAEIMLQSVQLNVNDVAMEVGFENVSHFIHVFKSHFGITPKKFQTNSQ